MVINLLVARAELAGNKGDMDFVELNVRMYYERIRKLAREQEEFGQKMAKKLVEDMYEG